MVLHNRQVLRPGWIQVGVAVLGEETNVNAGKHNQSLQGNCVAPLAKLRHPLTVLIGARIARGQYVRLKDGWMLGNVLHNNAADNLVVNSVHPTGHRMEKTVAISEGLNHLESI